MTERVLSQIHAEEMGFLSRVHGMTLLDNDRSCEIGNTLNVELLLHRIKGFQPRLFRLVSKMPQERLVRRVLLAKYTHGKAAQRWVQGSGGMIASLTLLGPTLVWSQKIVMTKTSPQHGNSSMQKDLHKSMALAYLSSSTLAATASAIACVSAAEPERQQNMRSCIGVSLSVTRLAM